MLINWLVPFLLQVLYRLLSIAPGTSHFVASQRIVADAKTTWRRSASMAFFGVIAGYLVVSPIVKDSMSELMAADPGIHAIFSDITAGSLLTLCFGFVLSSMAIFLGLSSQIFEQAHLTRSLHLMGVRRSFYFRTQLFETLGPIIIVSLIGFVFGALLGMVMLTGAMTDVNYIARFLLAGAFLVVGWLFTIIAISAVEPLRKRTLTIGRDNA